MEKFLSRWLDAHQDTTANLCTLSQCITFCDVSGNGDHRLILAHLNLSGAERNRLRTYRGTTLSNDQPLPDIPSGVVSFYTDSHEPRLPAVAVSCGSNVLLFKNNKPFFKFNLPSLPISALETDVWHQLSAKHPQTDIPALVASLKNLPYNELSPRSQKLLTLPLEHVQEFIDRYGSSSDPPNMSVITCMATMNKNSLNKNAVACLVIATEAGQVYVLDPQGFNILHQASVSSNSSAPSHLCCSGMFDIEYRIIVACRDGSVCILRREWFEGRVLMQIPASIVDLQLLPNDNSVVIATYDKELHYYNKKGKKMWALPLSKPITGLCLVNLPHLSTTLIGVGLFEGPLQLYQGKKLVDTIPMTETVSAMRFGHLGQEENVLVIITRNGTLIFKILKRTADFNLSSVKENSNVALENQAKALPLPKRSKLFAEQAQRERENALSIHHTFQQDLIRLRLVAARNMVQVLQTQDQSVLDNVKQPIKLAAQVLGLGPRFTLILTLENMSTERAISDLNLILHAQVKKYKIETPFTKVPMIPPGIQYNIQSIIIENLDYQMEPDESIPIRVFVFYTGHTQPVLAATINMPPTDPLGFA